LAGAASKTEKGIYRSLSLLMPTSKLARSGMVRQCEGGIPFPFEEMQSLENTQFKLGEKAVSILDLGNDRLRRLPSNFEIRSPAIRMEQLVFSSETRKRLELAIASAKNACVLMEQWGLKKHMPYSRSLVLLFSGPSGTGKTAAAEAVACEMKKPLLVVDHSQIQNCFVGQTEKNIVEAFGVAKSCEAVLFWDEADSMLYDRDDAHRSWEFQMINVLLQELERFESVCILATNREVVLDKALQRRVAIKVKFERPARAMRRQIWKILLPKEMPLSDDVDIERLSDADLSGGEIKNVVLNAARLALERGCKGPVTMHNFETALEMEVSGQWHEERSQRVGFGMERKILAPAIAGGT